VSRAQLHNPGSPITLNLSGLEVTAFSISGLATYVLVPEFDACFDLGHCSVEASHLRNVLLTHAHQDHSGGVHRHLSLRAMGGTRPSRVFLPRESAQGLVDLLHAFDRFEEQPPRDCSHVVQGVGAGERFALSPRFSVDAFDVVHRIASRGFTVIEHRKKLREAYQGLPGAEIHAARLRGETVHDVVDVARFTYVGDSTVETLRAHPELGKSDVLFFEVTHLSNTPRARSEQYGHTHIDDFLEFANTHPDALASRHIVLKHFSMKYDAAQIYAALESFPDWLRPRVTLLA